MIKKKAVFCSVMLFVLMFVAYIAIAFYAYAWLQFVSSVIVGMAMYTACGKFYRWLIN